MDEKFKYKAIFFSVLCVVSASRALTFSKDTISAFDVPTWPWRGEESISLSNESNKVVTIDSLIIEFDDTTYASRYQIGWEEIHGADHVIRKFNGDDESHSTFSDNINLSAYNATDGEKIILDAGEHITMYSPYIGTEFSPVGICIDCDGGFCFGLHPTITVTPFYGKIIFVYNNKHDTLYLKAKREIWKDETSVIHQTQKAAAKNSTHKGAISLLGRKMHTKSNPPVIKLIRKTNGASLVNPIQVPYRETKMP